MKLKTFLKKLDSYFFNDNIYKIFIPHFILAMIIIYLMNILLKTSGMTLFYIIIGGLAIGSCNSLWRYLRRPDRRKHMKGAWLPILVIIIIMLYILIIPR